MIYWLNGDGIDVLLRDGDCTSENKNWFSKDRWPGGGEASGEL